MCQLETSFFGSLDGSGVDDDRFTCRFDSAIHIETIGDARNAKQKLRVELKAEMGWRKDKSNKQMFYDAQNREKISNKQSLRCSVKVTFITVRGFLQKMVQTLSDFVSVSSSEVVEENKVKEEFDRKQPLPEEQ